MHDKSNLLKFVTVSVFFCTIFNLSLLECAFAQGTQWEDQKDTNYTLPADEYVEVGQNACIENGDLTIPDHTTLTISQNAQFTFEPGHRINLGTDSSYILRDPNARILKAHCTGCVCSSGACCTDGCHYNAAGTPCTRDCDYRDQYFTTGVAGADSTDNCSLGNKKNSPDKS